MLCFHQPRQAGGNCDLSAPARIYTGVKDSQSSSAPLEETFKAEGLAAACAVRVCLPGQKSITVGFDVPQREKLSQEEMWDSKRPWHRARWGTGSDIPAVHAAPVWAWPQRGHGTPMPWPWHCMGTARPRHDHGTATARPRHGHGTASAQHRHCVAMGRATA